MSHARKEYGDFQKLAPDAYEGVLALGGFAAKAGMDAADLLPPRPGKQ